MESNEAREHLDLVGRVLAVSNRRVKVAGEFFVVWGIVGAAFCLAFQLILYRGWPDWVEWIPVALLIVAAIFSVLRGRVVADCSDGPSIVQREYYNVMWIAFGMAAIVDCASFRLFEGWGAAAIWSVVESIILFYIGMHQNRRALAGGIVVVASLVAANFTPAVTGYVLAAGMLIGYCGFGLAEMLGRD